MTSLLSGTYNYSLRDGQDDFKATFGKIESGTQTENKPVLVVAEALRKDLV